MPLLALDLGIATPGGTGAGLRPFAGVAKVKGATAGYYVLEFYTRRFFAQHFYAGPGIAIGKVFADYVPQFSDSGFTYRIDLGREFPMARHFALGIEGVHLGMLGKNGRYFIFGIQLSPRIYLN
ncbi:MAG: hypothetical protein HYT87_11420 [Nitrospirae bacterium]|nr:hypothetical protein [Nitrospirota bacterium]